jgi:histidinol-phosphate phosphatase family protein
MGKAVFLDKDGTLVEDVPYNVDPARVVAAPHAAAALASLSRAGYRLIVVSNQPGVAYGRFPEAGLEALYRHLRALIPALEAFYYCPHAPEEGCACRKPACGLLLRAAYRHGIDLARSWMVGDILDDVEAGRRAGCRTVLLDNGNETEWRRGALREPHFVARDLREAAAAILHCRPTVKGGVSALRARTGGWS